MADDTTSGTGLRFLPAESEVKTTRVPLPPQLKAEVEQKRESESVAEAIGEAALLEEARKAVLSAIQASVTVAEPVVAKKAEAPDKCPSCGTPISPEQASFSFCTHCGADLPKAGLSLETRPTVPPVRKPSVTTPEEFLANGVRDPRSTVRKIAQVHAGTAQAQAVLQGQQTTSTQVEFEFRREVNPTLNAILSFLFPGVGQMLNGQVGKGILLILAAFVAITLLGFSSFGIELLIARAIIAIDAYKIGEKRRNGHKVGDGDWDVA